MYGAMKTLILLTLLTISAFAQRNPQIRTCNIPAGTFNAYDVPGDNIGHCIYGAASVDTISLMEKVHYDRETIAVQQFMDGVTRCNGSVVIASNERESIYVCMYSDNSSIRLSTLQAGSAAGSNASLVNALNTQF